MKKCDLGILLGGPILEKQFNALIALLDEKLRTNDESDTVRGISD